MSLVSLASWDPSKFLLSEPDTPVRRSITPLVSAAMFLAIFRAVQAMSGRAQAGAVHFSGVYAVLKVKNDE